MKKLAIKNWLIIGMITTGIFGSGMLFAKDGDVKSIENNRLKNRKEYKDMKATLSRIEDDQARIVFHKAELKKNKKADLVIPAHMSKKEIIKAKADLKRDKKYLKTDRKDLKADQKVAICASKQAERSVSKDLRVAKRELRKDLRKDNTAALTADVQKVNYLTLKKQKMENSTASLETDVDDFFAYLDDEIDQVV